MAEHLGQTAPPAMDAFAAMGKPIRFKARQAGFEHCKAMGLNSERAYSCVQAVAEKLERDQPYEAQHAAMAYVDLTGSYRLFAVLLAAALEEQRAEEKP